MGEWLFACCVENDLKECQSGPGQEAVWWTRWLNSAPAVSTRVILSVSISVAPGDVPFTKCKLLVAVDILPPSEANAAFVFPRVLLTIAGSGKALLAHFFMGQCRDGFCCLRENWRGRAL